MSRHRVLCGDFASGQDPDEEWEVPGFASAEAAAEYARRFIRAQIEDLRRETPDPAALREAYYTFGEYAAAEGFDSEAWVNHCIAMPATRKAEVDYAALEPGR
ncbi:hypothetical protein JYK14_22595 [Siccirubricoccus sp. KC 17139]|uniref:Uncharacterized protein n=1 Tax=Siccirubricoccus soli TaxID=2899147 RepID=A0ABT1DAF7_9PROT|nr:hypothetical protein [Siccirubricoccus soli]MCO6418925.1 hypothetical protein [Siccirubricoccus soli]MCP2685060.1 hypothetical protein [Siccirubricoccus soli]